jgi:hypothetical protein
LSWPNISVLSQGGAAAIRLDELRRGTRPGDSGPNDGNNTSPIKPRSGAFNNVDVPAFAASAGATLPSAMTPVGVATAFGPASGPHEAPGQNLPNLR